MDPHAPAPKKKYSLTLALPELVFFVIVLGLFVFWQHKMVDKRLGLLELKVAALHDDVRRVAGQVGMVSSAPDDAEPARKAAAAWENAVSSLPQCGADMDGTASPPDKDVIAGLGLSDLVAEGLTAVDLCIEKSGGIIGAVFAKQELTQRSPAEPPTCADFCDSLVFVSGEARTGQMFMKRSARRLGVFAESYPQQCRIDGMLAGEALTGDLMLVVCGSGEAGGYTHWYKYAFGDDSLSTAQILMDISSGTYEVKDEATLELFRFKKNP